MEKSNQERLEEYLVGEKGYLKSDISNGKVIMLSGKWGSGKTHFWKSIIATDDLKKDLSDKGSAYSYISLYGKSSIEEIENDIFGQIYFSAIGGENVVTKTFSTFTKYSKRYGNLIPSFDFSKLADGLKEEQKDNKERVSLERLKNGAIICFDDFERKSKEIDLNDLFGFITQLTLNFDCKVVIILNDDVFEGEEKKIFSNVKEKSVSKFLKYEPSIKELFETIFSNERYRVLDEHKEIILKTIEETGELNARIYIQVLDNLVEWIKNQDKSVDILRCLILVNINFVLNHTISIIRQNNDNEKKDIKYLILKNFNNTFLLDYISLNEINSIKSSDRFLIQLKNNIYEREEKNYDTKNDVFAKVRPRNLSRLKIDEIIDFINNNEIYLKSLFFLNKLKVSKNINDETFQKINNFIETGILINE